MLEMQSSFERPGPDILMVRGGGGCLSVFGTPFFVAGIGMIFVAAGLIPISNADEVPAWFYLFLPFFALPFVLVGGNLMLGRSGIIIDRGENRLREWWGLLRPMKWKEWPLQSFTLVRLRRESGDSADFFPVELWGVNGEPRVQIMAPGDFDKALNAAKDLARFLALPLEDVSARVKVARALEYLDETYYERLRREGLKVNREIRPPDMRTEVNSEPGRLELTLPPRRFHIGHLIAILIPFVPGVALLIWLYPWMFEEGFADFWRHLLAALALGIPALIGFWILKHLLGERTSLIVTPESLSLRYEQNLFPKKTVVQEIPVKELIDLSFPTFQNIMESSSTALHDKTDTASALTPDGRPLSGWMLKMARSAPHPGITVRSSQLEINFGRGLPEDELGYLCTLIRQALLEQSTAF